MVGMVSMDVGLTRKREQALWLRASGATYDDIAHRLGYANRSGAYKAVRSGLKATLKPPADAVRNLELARLDDLFRVVYPVALNPAHPGNLKAIDQAVRIIGLMSMLHGVGA